MVQKFYVNLCYSWFPFQVLPEGVEVGGQLGYDGGGQLVLPHEQPLVRPRRPHATGKLLAKQSLSLTGNE